MEGVFTWRSKALGLTAWEAAAGARELGLGLGLFRKPARRGGGCEEFANGERPRLDPPTLTCPQLAASPVTGEGGPHIPVTRVTLMPRRLVAVGACAARLHGK